MRLRAVWMGRKIESFWSSNLGSILELKFRVEKSAVFEAQKRLNFYIFSYKEISVPKIALKPLVPSAFARCFGHFAHFAHFWLDFALILGSL